VLDVENNEGALKSPSLMKLCSYFVLISLLPETYSTMFSALLNIVPVLNGTNWQSWSESMDAYIMSEGCRHVLTTTRPNIPAVTLDNDGNVDNQSNVDKATEKQEDWDKDNERVMGYIHLRVSPDVA
jgi:hypothetical protein